MEEFDPDEATAERGQRFPCDACGADMRFEPAAGHLTCDHCGNSTELASQWTGPAIRELDFASARSASLPEAETEELRLTRCTNCGAELRFEDQTHARECPFCATPVVVGTGTSRLIKPGAVLPFAVGEAQARQSMTDWLGRLWFAPGGLQEYARKGRRLTGIYVPYWTFDADTKSAYRGERGTVYYVTRTVTRNGKRVQQRVQKVRWRARSGRVARWFDDVLVLAARSLPKRYTDALEPWDLSALEPYQPEYLAGFQAEGYTIGLQDGHALAREKMDRVIARDVRFDIGGDRQRIHAIDTTISDVTFKHVLLPVWMAAYKYRGKSFRFVVNGQSGKVQGERPWSWIKIALAATALAIVAAIIGYLAATAENGGAM